MQSLLDQYHLKYEFVEATDGSILGPEEISQVYSADHAIRSIGRELGKGEIACALSHKRIYERMVEEKIPYVVILEDDVIFDSMFIDFMEVLSDLPPNWDCVLLNYYKKSPFYKFYCVSLRNRIPLNKTLRLVRFIETMDSSAAYALSLSGAHKLLLKLNKGIIKPIDLYTGDEEILNLYGILPKIVEIDSFFGQTSSIEIERDLIREIKNSNVRIYLKKLKIFYFLQRLNRKRIEVFYCLFRVRKCLLRPKKHDAQS